MNLYWQTTILLSLASSIIELGGLAGFQASVNSAAQISNFAIAQQFSSNGIYTVDGLNLSWISLFAQLSVSVWLAVRYCIFINFTV